MCYLYQSKKFLVQDIELAYDDVTFTADIVVVKDLQTGDIFVYEGYVKEDVPEWKLKKGDWFDPLDTISVEDLPIEEAILISD